MRNYLKEARKKMGYTQEEVAKHLKISTNYYCDIENGERQHDMKAQTLIGLSEVLRIPVSTMLEQERKIILESKEVK